MKIFNFALLGLINAQAPSPQKDCTDCLVSFGHLYLLRAELHKWPPWRLHRDGSVTALWRLKREIIEPLALGLSRPP